MRPDFILPSPETGTDYHVFVYRSDAARAAAPRPVVLFMDGDDQFAAATAAFDELRAANRVDALWLVGVGYGASYTGKRNRRGRDYTPVPHSDEPTSGGGDAFLQFLTGTLWAELNRRLPVDTDQRGIAGHSLGSLLVLHALFQPQPFFTHYLASAPSIWWADRAILDQAGRRRAAHASLPAQLVLSVGEDDSDSMTGDLALLEAQLAARPFANLRVTSQRFASRNHYDVLPDAFRAGLEALFPNSDAKRQP